jgi:hypothetical protein
MSVSPVKCGWPLLTAGVGYELFVPLSTHGCLGFLCWKFSLWCASFADVPHYGSRPLA